MGETGKKNKTLSEKLKGRNVLRWTRCRWQGNTNKSKGTRVTQLRIGGRFLKYGNENSIFINERGCLISYVTTRFPRWSPTHSQPVAYLQNYFINKLIQLIMLHLRELAHKNNTTNYNTFWDFYFESLYPKWVCPSILLSESIHSPT